MIQLVTFQEGMILLRVEHRLILLHLLNIKISISLIHLKVDFPGTDAGILKLLVPIFR